MTHHYGLWVSYSGVARLGLAAILLVVAAGVVLAGVRLPLPAGPARPRSRRAVVLLMMAWSLSVASFLAALAFYVHQILRAHLIHAHGLPPDYIFPVTLISAGVTFFVIAVSGGPGGRTAVMSAVIGAMAGPMVFELPFDLIVMARTYPPVPPHPALYRAMFFLPLFLIEITTLWMLTLSPMVKVSRATFYSFALMLAIFAGWAMTGFGYPSSPVPIAFNVVSKLLAFGTVLTLFLPQPGSDTQLLSKAARKVSRLP